MLLFSVYEVYHSPNGEETRIGCIAHTLTRDMGEILVDDYNLKDNRPGYFYELLQSDSAYECDFCGSEFEGILWENAGWL